VVKKYKKKESNDWIIVIDEILYKKLQDSNTYQYIPETQATRPCLEVNQVMNSGYMNSSTIENFEEPFENVYQVSCLNSEKKYCNKSNSS